MTDTRKKDANWSLNVRPDGNVASMADAQLAVLMDIRDELKKLNQLLYCTNFMDIPLKLDAIRKNTTKPRKAKKPVARKTRT